MRAVILTSLVTAVFCSSAFAGDVLTQFAGPDVCYAQNFGTGTIRRQYPDTKIGQMALWRSEHAVPGEHRLSLYATLPTGLGGVDEWIVDALCTQDGDIATCTAEGRGSFTLQEAAGIKVTVDNALVLESYMDPSVLSLPASEWGENPPLVLGLSDRYPCGVL